MKNVISRLVCIAELTSVDAHAQRACGGAAAKHSYAQSAVLMKGGRLSRA